MKRLFKIILTTLLFVLLNVQLITFAEIKTADFTIQEKKGDLQVLFTFDKEAVDIEFISPSGKIYTKNDALYDSDGLWASYKIVDAEVGQWKVRYDKKSNAFIDYSIADNNLGLWAQYFNIDSIDDTVAKISFRFDDENDNSEYNFEISAIDRVASSSQIIFEGTASPNQDIRKEIDLYELSSGEYYFSINAWKEVGLAEIFDKIDSDAFTYNNPNEPDFIEDFSLSVNPLDYRITANWKQWIKKKNDAYKISFYEDDVLSASEEYDGETNNAKFLYNGSTKKIRLELQYKNKEIWSKKCIKELLFYDYYLYIDNPDSNDKILILKYKTKGAGKLNVYNELNDEDLYFDVNGEGSYSIDLLNGKNSILVILYVDNNINYVLSGDYYYSDISPTIRLFEDIDGKWFNSNKVSIIGEAKNADSLKINNIDVELKNGVFDDQFELSAGENVFDIEAYKNNGNSSKMTIRLYRKSGAIESVFTGDIKNTVKSFIPLFASLFVSLVIIIVSLFKIKKKNKDAITEKKSKGVVSNILLIIFLSIVDGLLIFYYIKRLIFTKSLAFIDLAEKSVNEASIYLDINKNVLIAFIVILLLIIVNILILVIKIKKKK